MTSLPFVYQKQQVIQALRYHFISRPEIKGMIIVVNIFAVFAAALFYFKKVTPLAFLVASVLWFVLMIAFWFVLPYTIYSGNKTFKDRFTASLDDAGFSIRNDSGGRSWPWSAFSRVIESPHFFHLYFNPRSFFLVPKGAFPENTLAQARHIFNERIGR